MTAREQMEQLYAQVETVRSLEEDIAIHREEGALIVDDPRMFLLARPVNHLASDAEIRDPRVSFPREEQDTWYVYALAGDMRLLYAVMPYPLPWCAWHRLRPGKGTGRLRFYSTWNAISRTWGISQKKVAKGGAGG